jgi:hypothetical protein
MILTLLCDWIRIDKLKVRRHKSARCRLNSINLLYGKVFKIQDLRPEKSKVPYGFAATHHKTPSISIPLFVILLKYIDTHRQSL